MIQNHDANREIHVTKIIGTSFILVADKTNE